MAGTREEIIRFLRAKGEKSNTPFISSQKTGDLICSLYCTHRWPVLFYSTAKEFGGQLRPPNFELVLLHGVLTDKEAGLDLAHQALDFLGINARIESTGSDDEVKIVLPKKKDAPEIRSKPEHLEAFDSLIPGRLFFSLGKFIGAKNRRFMYWTPAGEDIQSVMEV